MEQLVGWRHPVEGNYCCCWICTYPGVHLEGELVADAYLHDERRLPHTIGGDLNDLFPVAVAGPEIEETAEPKDELEKRGTAVGEAGPRERGDASAMARVSFRGGNISESLEGSAFPNLRSVIISNSAASFVCAEIGAKLILVFL